MSYDISDDDAPGGVMLLTLQVVLHVPKNATAPPHDEGAAYHVLSLLPPSATI